MRHRKGNLPYLPSCTGELGYDGRYAWSQSDAYQVFGMYTMDFAYDGPIFLVPLSLSYPS